MKNRIKHSRQLNNISEAGKGIRLSLLLKPLAWIDYLLNNKLDLVLFLILFLWLLPIFIYPFLNIKAIHYFHSYTCHQNPARSFWLYGNPLPVCARCTGVYLGCMAASFLVFIFDIRKPLGIRYFLLSLIIIFGEMAAENFIDPGSWGNTLRSATGVLAGSSFFFFFSPTVKRKK